MALRHYVVFDTARETLDGKGWHLTWWEDTQQPQPITTEEYFFRLAAPTGGVDSSSKTITNKALTTNVATITTSAPHGFVVGDWVTVNSNDPIFNGTFQITTVPLTTTFTYAKTNANVTSAAATGTAASQPSAFERIQNNMLVDPIIQAYFTKRSQDAVLAANSSTIIANTAAAIAAEGVV
jgi:hypothetical protein